MSATTVSSLPLRDIALEGPATGPAVGWDLIGRVLTLSVTDGRDIAQYGCGFLVLYLGEGVSLCYQKGFLISLDCFSKVVYPKLAKR